MSEIDPALRDHAAVLRGFRELRADHRGVTLRELLSRMDRDDVEIRAAVNLARARGDIARLGRSPSGSQLYGLTSLADADRV